MMGKTGPSVLTFCLFYFISWELLNGKEILIQLTEGVGLDLSRFVVGDAGLDKPFWLFFGYFNGDWNLTLMQVPYKQKYKEDRPIDFSTLFRCGGRGISEGAPGSSCYVPIVHYYSRHELFHLRWAYVHTLWISFLSQSFAHKHVFCLMHTGQDICGKTWIKRERSIWFLISKIKMFVGQSGVIQNNPSFTADLFKKIKLSLPHCFSDHLHTFKDK